MREIRARIAKGSGLDITNQQIHELAARRLESILDPRTVKPQLLEQLRRGATADLPAAAPAPAVGFQESALYDSSNGFVQFMRRLLRPLLNLFMDPAPIGQAFGRVDATAQAAAEREAARERRHAEWNALQFELLQRMVTETSRVSIEMQSLALRIDSLAARVDFNDRRVRSIESTAQQVRASGRQHDQTQAVAPREAAVYASMAQTSAAPPDVSVVAAPAPMTVSGPAPPTPGEVPSDGARKRRRRRRGRRSSAPPAGAGFAAVVGDPLAAQRSADMMDAADTDQDVDDSDEPGDDEPPMPAAVEQAPEAVAGLPASVAPARFDAEPTAPQSAAAPEPFPAPEQPMPPRDEAAPAPDSPSVDTPDPGPADR